MPERPTLDELAARIAAKRQPGAPIVVEFDRRGLVAALYVMGASQKQLSMLFDVSKGTIKEMITSRITPLLRQQIRPPHMHKPILGWEEVEFYRNHYMAHRLDYAGLDPVTLAAKLRALPMEG